MEQFAFSRTLGAGKHFLGVTDLNVLVDTSSGAVELVLPKVETLMSFLGNNQGYSSGAAGIFPLSVVDAANNANINNITIVPADNNKVSGGASSVIINVNGGSAFFKPVTNTLWGAVVSVGSGMASSSNGKSESKGIFNTSGFLFTNIDLSKEDLTGYYGIAIQNSNLLGTTFEFSNSAYCVYWSSRLTSDSVTFKFTNNSKLLKFGHNNNQATQLLNVIFENNPVLDELFVNQQGLGSGLVQNVSIVNCPALLNVSFFDNALTVNSVDSILQVLDTNGLSNGTITLTGGTNSPPTGGGANPNLLSLLSKGWTIDVN